MNTALKSSATQPGVAPPTTEASQAEKNQRPLWKPVVIAIVALAGIAWGGHSLLHAYRYERTDNAYLVGHLHQVSPQIDGQVKEVLVQDNQQVKAGDVLVRLDPLEFEIAAQKAQAGLAQARGQESQVAAAAVQADAQAEEARARVAQAEAQIGQARTTLDLAQLTLGRNDQLFKTAGAATQADVDNAHSGFAAAQAAMEAATANRNAAQAAVGSAQAAQKAATAQAVAAAANVAAALSAVHESERQLAYAVITAPAAGRVGNKNVEPGNRVTAGQTILAIAESTPWIVANFKETQLARMQAGQAVEITIDALPGQTLTGRIDSLSPASGAQFALLPPDNATGNFNKVVQRIPVKINLDADSLAHVGDRLRFGFSVIVDVRVR